MTRSKKDESHSEQAESVSKSKRYRFECSRKQLFFYASGLILALSWMFVFGILIGRGVPLVQSKEASLRAEFLRFLGLGKELPPPPENVAETWENPKKMLESLNYYEDLTNKTPTSPHAPSSSSPAQGQQQLPKKPSPEASDQKAKASTASPQSTEIPSASQPTKPTSGTKGSSQEAGPGEISSEHFTLLISSLRDTENAQRLVEQLRAKGYPTRLEALDLSGSGRWNRVLVGSFQSRAEALRFAAEFNRREKMEGLVIRESH